MSNQPERPLVVPHELGERVIEPHLVEVEQQRHCPSELEGGRSRQAYMQMLFQRVALELRPARILEIGFGLGISARLIQQYLQPAEHHIAEIVSGIFADLVRFAGQRPGVMAPLGDWRCASLQAPFVFVFYDPFDYFSERQDVDTEASLLRGLVGRDGVLCHPHFGDGPARSLPGFRNVIVERFAVPPIAMADGSSCDRAAAVLCYPTD